MNDAVHGDTNDPQSDRDVAELAERLVRSRPAPGAALRGQLRTFLAAVDASGLLVARPQRLWLRVAVCASAGGALLGLVAAGIGGWGPFAA